MKKKIILLVGMFLSCFSTFISAHHSRYGVFDSDTLIEVEAILTEIKWSNPHVQFAGDVTNNEGATQNWKIESTAVSMLRSRGIDRQFLNIGDTVKVAGYAAVNGEPEMLALNLLLADGTEVLIDNKATPYFASADSNKELESVYDSAITEKAIADADGIFRVWSAVVTDPASFPMFKGGYPVTQAAQETQQNWQPDPEQQLSCWAKDMPILMVTPHPIEFLRQGDNILMKFEEDDAQRLIHMSNESQGAEITASSMGYSVGSWQDNTLIVETAHIAAQAFDDRGTPVSDNIRLVERFTISDDEKRLDYQISFFDPETFTDTFDLTRYWVWRPERTVQSWDCE